MLGLLAGLGRHDGSGYIQVHCVGIVLEDKLGLDGPLGVDYVHIAMLGEISNSAGVEFVAPQWNVCEDSFSSIIGDCYGDGMVGYVFQFQHSLAIKVSAIFLRKEGEHQDTSARRRAVSLDDFERARIGSRILGTRCLTQCSGGGRRDEKKQGTPNSCRRVNGNPTGPHKNMAR